MMRQGFLFCLLIAATEATIVAQLSGEWEAAREYRSWDTDIADFEVAENDGFDHRRGRLAVPSSGYYYIYAQAWFENYRGNHKNRVAIAVDGVTVSLLQTSRSSDYGGVFSGTVKYLFEGEEITLKTVYPSKLWMGKKHTFFGAYKI